MKQGKNMTLYMDENLKKIERDSNNNIIINKPDNLNCRLNGRNNVISFDKGVMLSNESQFYLGTNNLIHIGSSRHTINVNISVNNNCSFILGRNNYFNGRLTSIVSEETNVVIGSECLFSFGIMIRTADPHLIYDSFSHERINPSKNVMIGDHCWIGQNSLILKGSKIGSGSILGACSVLSGKQISSNTIWAGNPARLVKENIFWDGSCVHTWTEKETKQRWHDNSTKWIYSNENNSTSLNKIDEILSTRKSAFEKFNNIRQILNCEEIPCMKIKAHLSNIGWVDYFQEENIGCCEQNSSLKSNHLEAISLSSTDKLFNLLYKVKIKNNGWTSFVKEGENAGTTGKSLPLQGFELSFDNKKYQIEYKVFWSDGSTSEWVKSGTIIESESLNIIGMKFRVEELQE